MEINNLMNLKIILLLVKILKKKFYGLERNRITIEEIHYLVVNGRLGHGRN